MSGIVRTGIYRHYKGGLYQVLGVARHTETLEHFVVYRSCSPKEDLWVRPAKMFVETLKHPVTGTIVQRFAVQDEIKETDVYFCFFKNHRDSGVMVTKFHFPVKCVNLHRHGFLVLLRGFLMMVGLGRKLSNQALKHELHRPV